MAHLATTDFLEQLKAIYLASRTNQPDEEPETIQKWYTVAAVAFAASGATDAVPVVFNYALDELRHTHDGEELHAHEYALASKMRDALLMACLIYGLPRAIESLVALHSITPEELRSVAIIRSVTANIAELERIGNQNFRALYGSSAGSVQELMASAYPDLAWFCATVAYGIASNADVLLPVERLYAIVAALIATDVPWQTRWHMSNARNVGAPLEEIKAVREITMKVAERAGVDRKEDVPEVEQEERAHLANL
ncbi:hypothetical protein WOLCODRAFT_94930 [Wolfiporia cocos MD-104 SS10]|uniref:Uncharacterized protein n=1 Tax=Wolfiporia cocos (strain MD-104) TaxID=742152 RepID=A0A2H3JDW3_WOLCO|nr:hypothetical protein WOLCODRAFT_94930 [Wolfiporia cocos MD-104 SS10]